MAQMIFGAHQGYKVPALPTRDGLYHIGLPPAAAWTTGSVIVQPLTDLPRVGLYLGGAETAGAGFANVDLKYVNPTPDVLVENGDFQEEWPNWVRYPEWLFPENSFQWSPARLLAWIAVGCGMLLAIRRPFLRRRVLTPAGMMLWLSLSALMIFGVMPLSDLVRQAAFSPLLRTCAMGLVWAAEVGLFGAVGWAGSQAVGRRARVGAAFIPLLAGLAITPTVIPWAGSVSWTVNFQQFSTPVGVTWLVIGVGAACAGAWWGTARKQRRRVSDDGGPTAGEV